MASSRLRGITIEINGDTTRLDASLADVNRQAGSLQHELSEVNRLLRVDPGNTELLAQQQELYNQQLDNSREQLERLRSVEGQMQEQFRVGTIGEEQMRSYYREITRAEQGMVRAQQAIDAFNEAAANNGANVLARDLAAIDQRAGSLQNELREVDRLLQMDPGNTELLAQQQELYNQQLENSNERLQRLRREESQMQEQLRAGTIGEEQMRNFQREIVGAEQDVQRAEQAIRDLEEGAGDAGDAGEDLGEQISNGMKVASAAVAALGVAMITGGVMAMDDMQKALNQLQMSTGSTDEEMVELKKSMTDIYNENFGEDFNDIALSMAEIKQQTGLTGAELEDTTKYALMMRDVFELDVNEGVRGANALMKQFGLSSEEAYNLIAIGAQSGLNQNQDLADQLAEYSVYYSEMGFTADEMFDKLAEGTKTGAFQIDFLNDAVKEFSIITKDGSDNTKAAFTELGFDAEELTNDFAEGGEKAKAGFEKVTKALMEVEDETQRNALGVSLFGTKWEDNGTKVMAAVMSVNDSIDTTRDALSAINAIQYDSFGEALTGIGRQVQTGLLIPIGEMLLPVLNAFAAILQVLVMHMDVIAPILAGLGVALITFTIATQGQAVATNAAALAQGILNTIMSANPIGLVVTAIMGLIAVFVSLGLMNEELTGSLIALWEALKGLLIQILSNIADAFSATWDLIKTVCITFYKLITGDFKGFFQGLFQIVTECIPNMFQAGKGLLNGVWDGMKEVWVALSEWVSTTIDWLAEKLTFWRDSESEMEGGDDADGSHAKGLSYVPFDGYTAILHQGERVLTATENRQYEDGSRTGRQEGITVNQHIYSPTPDPRAEQRAAAREFKKLALVVGT